MSTKKEKEGTGRFFSNLRFLNNKAKLCILEKNATFAFSFDRSGGHALRIRQKTKICTAHLTNAEDMPCSFDKS
jgi:hypothetical protein